jgi:nucleotide sugar dehydrogenase
MNIEIVGAGVVGRAFGQALLSRGHDVRWVDSDAERVHALRANGLTAALPEEPADPCPLYVICVPTPTVGREQDRMPLTDPLARVASLLRPDLSPTVVIRSTILPGTSRQWAVPFLERASGLQRGEHFRFVYCPEFLRGRHAAEDATAPRIHLFGELAPGHGDTVAQVLAAFEAPVVRMSLEAAELQKYVHNAFNALKITFFNDMRRVATQLNLAGEVEAMFSVTCESAEGLWNPSYGTRNWGPVSGACLPKDIEAFLGWMRSCDLKSPLLDGLSPSQENE